MDISWMAMGWVATGALTHAGRVCCCRSEKSPRSVGVRQDAPPAHDSGGGGGGGCDVSAPRCRSELALRRPHALFFFFVRVDLVDFREKHAAQQFDTIVRIWHDYT